MGIFTESKNTNLTYLSGDIMGAKTYSLRREYLVCYDIEDNKIRSGIFKELEKYGLKPAQKSVFWGYLTLAELTAIKRYLKSNIQKTDKAFITRTNFNGKALSYVLGHEKKDFSDWVETDVI